MNAKRGGSKQKMGVLGLRSKYRHIARGRKKKYIFMLGGDRVVFDQTEI